MTSTAAAGPDIAAVVISYNTRDLLRDCLASLAAEPVASVTVVDNGSSDGSPEMVRAEFPSVRLIVDPSNPGFGAAANRGIRCSSERYVLLLNADTRVMPGAFENLVRYLDEHPRAAIAGPRILHPDGRLQPSCFPFLGTAQFEIERSFLGPMLARVPLLRRRYLLQHSDHDRPRRVPWVLGAALAIRREAFEEVGGFDESYFLYAEEIDLCYRLRAARWQVHFAPVADVVHVGGASTSQNPVRARLQNTASTLQFCRTHYSPARAAGVAALVRAGALLRLLRARIRLLTAGAGRREQLARDLQTHRYFYEEIRKLLGVGRYESVRDERRA